MCDGKHSTGALAPKTEQGAQSKSQLAPEDKWLETLDFEAFKNDIQTLGKELKAGQGEEDVQHLSKILWWNRIVSFCGLATIWMFPNPFTILCLSLASFSRWTMVGHHVCHGGYDNCDKSGRFNRFKFAVGSLWRRVKDWFDWMLPEAWGVEHNQLHHYHLNEGKDPDLVEMNVALLRGMKVPLVLKYMVVAFFMMTWKWFYYAPSTYNHLKLAKLRKEGVKTDKLPRVNFTLAGIFEPPSHVSVTELFARVLFPYFFFRFAVLPLPVYAFFGPQAAMYALVNIACAEALTNVHGFIAVVTNHAGDDLYKFEKHCRPRGAHFYLRQVIGSVDFATGTDMVDFWHGFLNYQIEHHLWPDLSMLSYQKSQPLVKEICAKHGVPYVQQSVWWRLKKTVDIMVGTANMRVFPSEYEPTEYDEAPAAVPGNNAKEE